MGSTCGGRPKGNGGLAKLPGCASEVATGNGCVLYDFSGTCEVADG